MEFSCKPNARQILCFLVFWGQIQNYMMRTNLSIVIVAMVEENNQINATNLNCSLNCSQNGSNMVSLNTSIDKKKGDIDKTYDWSPSLQGIILASFGYGYITTQIIGGRLAEYFGIKRIYGGCLFLTALVTFALPLAAKTHVYMFIALRALQGIFEGVTFPSLHAMTARWIPPLERNSFVARCYFGGTFGTVFTYPLCGLLTDTYGWESSFYVIGAITVVWFILWCIFVFDTPNKHPRISVEEKDYIAESLGDSIDSQRTFSVPWRSIFTSVPFIALLASECGNSWGLSTLLKYTPRYMKDVQGIDMKTNGLLSGLPFAFRYFGAVILSAIADIILTKRLMSTTNVRRLFNSIAMIGPSVALIMIAFVPPGLQSSTTYIVVLLCVGQFFNGAVSASLLSSHLDLAPNYAATLLGICNSLSSFISFIVPMIVGLLLENDTLEMLEKWKIIFMLPAVLYILTNFTYVFFISGDIQTWNSNFTNWRASMTAIESTTPKLSNKTHSK